MIILERIRVKRSVGGVCVWRGSVQFMRAKINFNQIILDLNIFSGFLNSRTPSQQAIADKAVETLSIDISKLFKRKRQCHPYIKRHYPRILLTHLIIIIVYYHCEKSLFSFTYVFLNIL